ncbi:MAG: hypothetical protein R3F38_11960 [Gammaproteobacteria bacterium]
MSQGNYIYRLFDIMEEFGDDTDVPWALVYDDQQPQRWSFFRHQDVDGVGLFINAQASQGVSIAMPLYKGVVPGTLQRLQLAWRKFRTRTPAPVRWRQWQPSADGRVAKHSQLLRGRLLSEAQTAQAIAAAKAQGVTLNSWLLWALNEAVAPVLTLPQPERAWGNTVNLRGQVKAISPTDNQSSIVTVVIAGKVILPGMCMPTSSSCSSQCAWGSWFSQPIYGWTAESGAAWQIRRYYSSHNSQMGTFSNLGVWNWRTTDKVKRHAVFAPCSTRR